MPYEVERITLIIICTNATHRAELLDKRKKEIGKLRCVMISDNLTPREEEVKSLVCQGLTNKEIIEKLNISITTLKTHLVNIYSKKQIIGEGKRCKLIVSELRKGK